MTEIKFCVFGVFLFVSLFAILNFVMKNTAVKYDNIAPTGCKYVGNSRDAAVIFYRCGNDILVKPKNWDGK